MDLKIPPEDVNMVPPPNNDSPAEAQASAAHEVGKKTPSVVDAIEAAVTPAKNNDVVTETDATKPKPTPTKVVFPKQVGNAWVKPTPQGGSMDLSDTNNHNNKKRSNVHFAEGLAKNNVKDDFVSLADIMEEQEKEKKEKTKGVSFCQDVESEEERQMRLAIEASLRDQQEEQEQGFLQFQEPEAKKRPPSALKNGTSVGFARDEGGKVSFSDVKQVSYAVGGDDDDDMDEDMRMAIALSLQDSGGGGFDNAHTDAGFGSGTNGSKTSNMVTTEEEEEDRKPSALPKKEEDTKAPADTCVMDIDEDSYDKELSAQYESGASASVAAASSSTPVAAAAAASVPDTTHSDHDESEKLARALHDAELAEFSASQSIHAAAEEASLQLALKLQQEEDARAAQSKREEMCGGGGSIGVRTVGREEFQMMQHLKTDKSYGTGDGRMVDRRKAEERGMGKLLANKQYDEFDDDGGRAVSASNDDDYENYYYYREDRHQEDHEMHGDEYDDDDGGIRMNPQKQQLSGENWQRLDKHTFIGPNNEVKTKHDPELQHRSNAVKLLGSHGAKLKDAYNDSKKSASISDRAYNAFKRAEGRQSGMKKGVATQGHGRAENMNAGKTRGGAMDGSVRLQITAAINSGLIDKCNGVVKEGKEALVYHAEGGWRGRDGDAASVDGSQSLPPVEVPGSDGYDVAVKVFKRISEFKGRGAYVDGDPRYHKQKFKTNDQREQVVMWAEKEYRNLIRADRAGLAVPKPLMCKENILFMRFCGEDGWPSPQLKEIEIKKGSDRWQTLYCQSVVAIRRLYHCARLVHADLSEYNLLVCPSWQISKDRFKPPSERSSEDETLQVVLIDFGQAVERTHPAAKELLLRDLSTVRDFFVKQGIKCLNVEQMEEFVLAPIEESSANLEELQTIAEDATHINDSQTEEETTDSWRHMIPGWSDEKDMESLLTMLKSV